MDDISDDILEPGICNNQRLVFDPFQTEVGMIENQPYLSDRSKVQAEEPA